MGHYRGSGGTLDTIYTDAEPFFRDATYPTDRMRTVVSEVLARLAGDGSVPAVHRLETAFGGGKTHTLIALVHLALKGRDIAPLVGDLLVPDVFDATRLHAPGEIALVGVAGDEIPVHEAKGKALEPYTLWGEIAYQVGGEPLYRELESDVTSHAAPGRAYFEGVFAGRRVLILLDVLAQYATRLNAARPTGAEELAAFLMPLLGYARSRPGLSVVVTLAGGSNAFAQQTRRLAELIGHRPAARR